MKIKRLDKGSKKKQPLITRERQTKVSVKPSGYTDPATKAELLAKINKLKNYEGKPKKEHSNLHKITGITLYIGEQKKLPKNWQELFLLRFAETGSIRLACEYANVSRTTIVNVRNVNNGDNDFEKRFQLAKKDYNDRLDEEMYRRGVEGVNEPVYYQGMRVDTVKKYSDPLLIKKIEAENPEKYPRGSGVVINQNNQSNVQVVLGFSEDDEVFSPD